MSVFEACIEFCENDMYEGEVLISCQDYCAEMEDIEEAQVMEPSNFYGHGEPNLEAA